MSDELVAFLRARLDESEQSARAVLWDGSGNTLSWDLPFSATVQVGSDCFCADDRTVANHIVEWDPARALLEIEAKRQLLADALAEKHVVVEDCWYTCPAATEERDGGETCNDAEGGKPCNCGRDARVERRLRLLAMPYVDHPDQREEWRP